MDNKAVEAVNRVKKLYLSCKDKEFNKLVGKIIAGDIKISKYGGKRYETYGKSKGID